MKWMYQGGEIELEGPMFRQMACPLQITRGNAPGGIAAGQSILVANATLIAIAIEFYGISGVGPSKVTLKSGAYLAGIVIGPYWVIKILDWEGRINRDWVPTDWARAFGEGSAQFFNSDASSPRLPAKPAARPAANPLDAAKARRKLLN